MHEACPQHPDPAYCTAHMAAWWGAVGPFIWQEHFEHICDDKEPPCPPHNHTLKVVNKRYLLFTCYPAPGLGARVRPVPGQDQRGH